MRELVTVTQSDDTVIIGVPEGSGSRFVTISPTTAFQLAGKLIAAGLAAEEKKPKPKSEVIQCQHTVIGNGWARIQCELDMGHTGPHQSGSITRLPHAVWNSFSKPVPT